MTWQYFLRPMASACVVSVAFVVASQAQAENNLISPDEAAAFARAQAEEVKAAAAGIQDEGGAESAVGAGAAPSAKSAKVSRNAHVRHSAGKADHDLSEEASVEETASLPVELPDGSRSARTDALKATALRPMIVRYASENGLPYELADAVVRLESRYNPGARNGAHVGLMQINLRTAQALGYAGGVAGLLDAETNLRYGLRYLAQAYRLAGGDTCGTILRYQFGHRTTAMTKASRAYCARVKVITAAAE